MVRRLPTRGIKDASLCGSIFVTSFEGVHKRNESTSPLTFKACYSRVHGDLVRELELEQWSKCGWRMPPVIK